MGLCTSSTKRQFQHIFPSSARGYVMVEYARRKPSSAGSISTDIAMFGGW